MAGGEPLTLRRPSFAEGARALASPHAAPKGSLGVWSRSVGESAMLILHFGGRYRPDTSRQRHDYATIRAAMQRSEAPLKELAMRYGLNQKTVVKWRDKSWGNVT